MHPHTHPRRPDRSHRRRRRVRAGLTLTLAVGLLAGCAGAPGGTPVDPGPSAQPVTAPAVHTTLVDELRLAGQLTFGEATPLPPVEGMLTALPVAGAVVSVGEQVFEADGEPVVLLAGERPFWRDLSVDSIPGADVRQLEENLAALGFLPRPPGERFDWRTRQAVRDWQRALGLARTGEFAAASAVVAATASVRVDQVTARLGDTGVSPATVGATTLHATANLTQAQARELAPGAPVTVTLRDGAHVEATLTTVDPGGLPTDDGGLTPPQVTIGFDDPEAAALLAAVGPSPVRITTRDAGAGEAATLVVPATALLATPGGGYAVEVWDGAAITTVPVEIGLAADARVQILGGDLAEGDLVVLAR
ncbi:peptidoglycan-binding protein [Xylanimonas ulmi]|uniref:Multidrug efflux pump subunit AcrA (Membrane-fusion protein) n=1 Tax=Xylanimonas ulmi TaxID=228973 RepID=A0A4Q7LYM4_9MICO|nr:peptidoglycan-binding protein [Xylanibacterium ulmi]RZS60375.1 multidrug efflux pump subunit AcrA (membrane-fusion protein) [Xylanibacterium ulmi]